MVIIITFWILFGLLLIFAIFAKHSVFLKDVFRNILALISIIQTLLLLTAIILQQSLLTTIPGCTINAETEWFIAILISGFALWKVVFVNQKSKINEVYKKTETLEEQTNVVPKMEEELKELVETIRYTKRRKK